MRAALALALAAGLPTAVAAQPSAAPAAVLPATPPPLAVAPVPRDFYLGMELAAGFGNAMMLDLGIDVAHRVPGTNLWGRLRGSIGGWAAPESSGGSLVQGLVGIEGRGTDRGIAGFAGIDLGLVKHSRDPYDDFGDPVPDPEAVGVALRPEAGVELGAGGARFRVAVATPFLYVHDDIAIALMVGFGFVVGD
jgi:hypothetical protein